MIVKNSVRNRCSENTRKLKRYAKETFEIVLHDIISTTKQTQ